MKLIEIVTRKGEIQYINPEFIEWIHFFRGEDGNRYGCLRGSTMYIEMTEGDTMALVDRLRHGKGNT